MGEEPGRLRALEAQVRAGFRHSRRDDHHRLCATKADEGCDCYARFSIPAHQALDALLAEVERLEEARDGARLEALGLRVEVERLARERDGAQLALESNAPLILDLTAEVERLAGERAQEVIDRDRILDVLRKEEAWRIELQAECERLAGRVAALESTLRFYGDLNAYEPSPRRVRAVILDEGQLARDALADVGG